MSTACPRTLPSQIHLSTDIQVFEGFGNLWVTFQLRKLHHLGTALNPEMSTTSFSIEVMPPELNDATTPGSAEAGRLRHEVTDTVQRRISQVRADAAALDLATAPLVDQVAALTQGGKKLRASLAYWAYRACGGEAMTPAILELCAALELYQASALFHDDLIDQSDTRRGQPSAHQAFATQHQAANWRGAAPQYGLSAGILLGDLTIALAYDAVTAAAALANLSAETTHRLVNDFSAMARTVALGQYLDLLAENQTGLDSDARLARAGQVAYAKSASYSAEFPLRLGAILAGANPAKADAFGQVGVPLGKAFQLRDDLLGVFGDPSVTGKPAGDDLVSGKRTMLIELALQGLDDLHARVLEGLLKRGELSPMQIDQARLSIGRSGAVTAVEKELRSLTNEALANLDLLDLPAEPKLQLRFIADQMTTRVS
jgi:geranylgeranyl diphosphate synthase, type I